MASQLENIISAYKTLAKIPSIVGGRLMNDGRKITSKWSVRNLDKGKATKYSMEYVLDDNLKVIAQSAFGTDISNELLSSVSPLETYRAVVREEKDKKDAKKQFLEVWSKNNLEHSIDLTALDLHGDVYADSEFGGLNWSPDESALVYVAERKLPKFEPYIKRKNEDKGKTDGSGEAKEAPKKGEEFLYRQDWGEQLVGKYLSSIVVCELQTEKVTVLDGLPESWCPGQVRFTPDGKSVVGVAWETEPRRLGLIFCTNRPSVIFNLTLDGTLTKISAEGKSVRSPKFSGAGDLYWLQRGSGGPHHACHELVKKGQSGATTVIPIVDKELKISDDQDFYGLYCLSLPSRFFTSDGRIVFCTPQQNEIRAYVADPDGGRIVDISNRSRACSTSVLDVSGSHVLAVCSDLNTPPQLYVAKLPSKGEESSVEWSRVSEPNPAPAAVASSHVEYLQLEHEGSADDVKSFTAIYTAPTGDKKLPLIVWPHGGPHSGFVNAFSVEAAMHTMLGFASLQINYRGSTGAGEASILSLPKRVGDHDVKDCKLATDVALSRYPLDPKRVGLSGGSHGGFLVTHLSGQYPDTYSAVVTRNPVIDVASMFNSTDIPDCLTYLNNVSAPGFASVRINYRGSSGHGDSFLRSLLGKCGTIDVDDCHLILTSLLTIDENRDNRFQTIDKDRVFLYGGSYGGFIIAHLAGRYPDAFKAMVIRNPLIDLATKGHYADNSDGCAVESGFEFKEFGPVSEAELVSMRRCSPLVHVHRVKAPTALLLGAGDKRVPHYQGLEYARRLKANGVATRIYMYDDNHSLSSPASEMDQLINGMHWFLQHF